MPPKDLVSILPVVSAADVGNTTFVIENGNITSPPGVSNTTSPADSSTCQSTRNGLSKASAVGIIVGSLAFCFVLAMAVVYIRRRTRQRRSKGQPADDYAAVSYPNFENRGTAVQEMDQSHMLQETGGSTAFAELDPRYRGEAAYEMPSTPRQQEGDEA